MAGLGYNRISNKSDGEAAIVAVKANAARYANVEAVPKESLLCDHAANGEIENYIKDTQRRQRATRNALGIRLGYAFDDDDPISVWTSQVCLF